VQLPTPEYVITKVAALIVHEEPLAVTLYVMAPLPFVVAAPINVYEDDCVFNAWLV